MMSDKRISDLVELTTLAADDVLPVVDADANATKRITGANLSTGIRGDIVSGDLPVGSIVQVVQAETTTEVTNTAAIYVATGLSASITPTSNTNKILIIFQQNTYLRRDQPAQGARIRLLRDATIISEDNNKDKLSVFADGSSVVALQGDATQIVLDSPATTSSITYQTEGRPIASNNNGFVEFQKESVPSTMVLMEVVA